MDAILTPTGAAVLLVRVTVCGAEAGPEPKLILVAGSRVLDGSVWRRAVPYVNVGGTWKVAEPWIKDAGNWKKTIQ